MKLLKSLSFITHGWGMAATVLVVFCLPAIASAQPNTIGGRGGEPQHISCPTDQYSVGVSVLHNKKHIIKIKLRCEEVNRYSGSGAGGRSWSDESTSSRRRSDSSLKRDEVECDHGEFLDHYMEGYTGKRYWYTVVSGLRVRCLKFSNINTRNGTSRREVKEFEPLGAKFRGDMHFTRDTNYTGSGGSEMVLSSMSIQAGYAVENIRARGRLMPWFRDRTRPTIDPGINNPTRLPGGVIVGPTITCPDNANMLTGGLLAPTIDPDPGASQGPQADEFCAGTIYSAGRNETAVPFSWNNVTGTARENKAYQVEIINQEQEAPAITNCLIDWLPTGSGSDGGSNANCIVADTNTESYSRLLIGATQYTWRARATCLANDGARRIGPFSTVRQFRSKGAPEKIDLRSPESSESITRQGVATEVVFQWDALPCGVTAYHLRIVGSADIPSDGKALSLDQRPTVVSADGLGQPVVVNGENRIEMRAILPTGDTYGWWVYADTPQGATPPLGTADVRKLTLKNK